MSTVLRFLQACALAALPLMTPPVLMISPATAKMLSFKGTGVAFPINVPDNWRVRNIDRGVEIRSPHEEVYL
jgi:hypothetical protein